MKKWRLVLLVLVSGFFAITFLGGTVAAIVGVMFFTRYIRLLQVQYESTIQHLANDKARATISSIRSFAAAFVGAGMMLLIGLLATNNYVVKPIRITLLIGVVIYVGIQLFNQHRSKIKRDWGKIIPRANLSKQKTLS